MTTNKKRSGFTLIELLVVVAIIAVIGAGVAVTYNRLDQRAKTAMEINDIGELTQTIKNWSFLHDWALPNELDSLIDTSDQLYSQMDGSEYGMGTVNGVNGLYAQSGFTLMAEDAPARVLDNLTAAGLNLVYRHDPAQTPANDSTFVPSGMGSGVDTSSTLSVLDTTSSQNSRTRAQAIVDAKSDADTAFAEDEDGNVTGAGTITVTYSQTMNMGGRTITYNENETFNSGADYTDAYTAANKTLKATPISKLAFVYPGGGAQMDMGTYSPMMAGRTMMMAMNMTDEIISNLGLDPDTVALPSEDAATAQRNGRKYWLVVMGLGRFASIYQGKGVRIDTAVTGKRYNSDASMYSRYLAVIRVPIAAYNGMTGTTEAPQIACVLSPQALSVAALNDSYRNDVEKTQN